MYAAAAASHRLPDDTAGRVVDELIDAGRHAVERGLVQASGGNLSARIPGTDRIVVTASGTWLDQLTPYDFAVLGVDGTHLGGAPKPSVEWRLHTRTYAVRPDVQAIVHLHPQHAVLVDLLGERIRCTTLDHAYYLRHVERVPFLPSGSDELAAAAAEAARECDAVVLAHHGCSALGDSVPMALRRALNLEEAATMTYRLLLAGDRHTDFPEEFRDRIITV
jgi:L-fuculose-phosphate aldolase